MKRLIISSCSILLLAIIFGIIFSINNTPSHIDCFSLKEEFDTYVQKSLLPISENEGSLCYGLFMGSNFSSLTPKWAVGELIKKNNSLLTFKGMNENATFSFNNFDNASYSIGKQYLIDMNNICRGFFMMADSRYPSPISETFVMPQEVMCE